MAMDFSPADAIAMARGNDDGFGSGNAWWIVILFMALWGGNGFGWGNNCPPNVATSADVQRATDFAALERQNNEGVAATRQAAYDVMTAQKDASYNNLSEIREIQNTVNSGFANMQTGICGINQSINDAKYAAALNTDRIIADNNVQTHAIMDRLCAMEMGNERRFHAIEMNAKDQYIHNLEREFDGVRTANIVGAATVGLAREPIYATTFSPFANPPMPPANTRCGNCY